MVAALYQHCGVDIGYDESREVWVASMPDGKSMSSAKLSDLRKRVEIGVAPPKVKLNIPVYVKERFGGDIMEGVVTSMRNDNEDEFNVTGTPSGKVFNRTHLFARNDTNAARMARMKAIEAEIRALQRENEKLREAMERADLPKEKP